LLLLCGQSQPSRRFVRALARLSPMQTRHFVAVSGDAIAFNTVYRDREVTWPIQDLPCKLIFFCHLNPVEEKRLSKETRFSRNDPAASGTEDLLLARDIVAALVQANEGDRPCADADELRERLLALRLDKEGNPSLTADSEVKLFTEDGNRSSGTGEHVVWLQPSFKGQRTKPEATLEVFGRQRGADKWALPVLGASTVGLLGSPLGQGPFLAASALFPEWMPRGGPLHLDYTSPRAR